jgi:hypothetical protein
MFTESINVQGNLEVLLLDENGLQKDYRKINNLVVAVGKDTIASRMVGNTTAIMSHMAVGSSNTAAATSQTTLGSELGRVVLDSTARAANTVTYVATFPAGTGTGSITEAGILNASSSGNLLCRTVFGIVTKTASDTVIITWNVTVA